MSTRRCAPIYFSLRRSLRISRLICLSALRRSRLISRSAFRLAFRYSRLASRFALRYARRIFRRISAEFMAAHSS